MKKVFITGGTGMVGSRIIELLEDKYKFTNLSRERGVDIADFQSLKMVREDREHDFFIHVAAKADVDGCEKDKKDGERGDAYKINVLGTKNVADACLAGKKKLIYISTDFVFDGDIVPDGGYKETDVPCPMNWYAETKYRGEKEVEQSGVQYVIARISYPYRKEFDPKKDFARAIRDRLKDDKSVIAVTDHIMTPTFIDDIARALYKLVEKDANGIYHVTGEQSLSPYEAALIIADRFGFDKGLIGKTTRAEFFKGKAYRPFNMTMNNNKIKSLGVQMSRFEDTLQ